MKLIEYFQDGSVELYDLARDIGEARNLAAAMPREARRLRERLAAWRHSVNAWMPAPNPAWDPNQPSQSQ